MLTLDFINVGNGDATLIRDAEAGFSMLVDCGHYALRRDDHPGELDPRSRRIFAGDFLREAGVTHLDILLLTHFHRDHVGGLGRVREIVALSGARTECLQLTGDLSMEIYASEAGLYQHQKQIFDDAFRGVRDRYALMRWGKFMNAASLRQRLYYHGKQIVLGGDLYGALWDRDTTAPCDILKLPHHGSLSSVNRKFLSQIQPKTIIVSVAAGRPDERPHPYIVGLLREFTDDVRFTDAVAIPGLAEPVFRESVHLEIP